jgi:hypothetical protein
MAGILVLFVVLLLVLSNRADRGTASGGYSVFDVGCWTLDVGR